MGSAKEVQALEKLLIVLFTILVEDLDVARYEHVPVLRSLVANGPYLTCLPYLDVERYIEMGNWLR